MFNSFQKYLENAFSWLTKWAEFHTSCKLVKVAAGYVYAYLPTCAPHIKII